MTTDDGRSLTQKVGDFFAEDAATVDTVATLPPAMAYSPTVGPELAIEWEQQLTTPISGAEKVSTALSPFTLRILPPLLYLSNPSLLKNSETGSKDHPVELGLIEDISIRGNLQNTLRDVDTLFGQVNARNNAGPSISPVYVSGGRSNVGTKSPSAGYGVSGDNGSTPVITDALMAQDIGLQLTKIVNTPPLTLLVNPTSLMMQFQKILQYQERSRTGLIFQAWGEEQPKMTVSGAIGAFCAGANGTVFSPTAAGTSVATGVQFAAKRDSASFQQLMALMMFYKSNGYIYDTIGKTNAHHMVGVISIEYDQMMYLGNMNSFGWGYEEAQPHGNVQFEIDFTVAQIYDYHDAKVESLKPMRNPMSTRFDDVLYASPAFFQPTAGSAVELGSVATALPSGTPPSVAPPTSSAPTLPPSEVGFKTLTGAITRLSFLATPQKKVK